MLKWRVTIKWAWYGLIHYWNSWYWFYHRTVYLVFNYSSPFLQRTLKSALGPSIRKRTTHSWLIVDKESSFHEGVDYCIVPHFSLFLAPAAEFPRFRAPLLVNPMSQRSEPIYPLFNRAVNSLHEIGVCAIFCITNLINSDGFCYTFFDLYGSYFIQLAVGCLPMNFNKWMNNLRSVVFVRNSWIFI